MKGFVIAETKNVVNFALKIKAIESFYETQIEGTGAMVCVNIIGTEDYYYFKGTFDEFAAKIKEAQEEK